MFQCARGTLHKSKNGRVWFFLIYKSKVIRLPLSSRADDRALEPRGADAVAASNAGSRYTFWEAERPIGSIDDDDCEAGSELGRGRGRLK